MNVGHAERWIVNVHCSYAVCILYMYWAEKKILQQTKQKKFYKVEHSLFTWPSTVFSCTAPLFFFDLRYPGWGKILRGTSKSLTF